MVLYIEYVIIDNLVVDYLLLKLLAFTYREKFSRWNLIISCLIGTISAVFMPFVMEYSKFLWLYKLLTGMFMILVLKKYKSFNRYILYLLIFMVYTFVFGGCAFAFLSLLDISYTINGLLLYNCEFPVSVFIVIFWIGSYIFRKIVVTINKQFNLNKFLYDIVLKDNGREVAGVGFFDSGNSIERDGKSVNIISLDMFFKLYEDYSIDRLMLVNEDDSLLKNSKYINIRGIGKDKKYLSFSIEKMVIDGVEHEDVFVAVALKNFDNFDCVINSRQVGGIK